MRRTVKGFKFISFLALGLLLGFSCPEASEEEGIRIFLPLSARRWVYHARDDRLLIVPGGRVMMFRVGIWASAPLLELRLNGRTYSHPYARRASIRTPQLLYPGKNRIVVEARTAAGQARREFVIELIGLPPDEQPPGS